ncbi:MAG TPA: YceD family protein [Gemmatimonadales bacterium]
MLMLRIDIRALRQGPVSTEADLAPDDPVFTGLDLRLVGPVLVSGVLQASGRATFFWTGEVSGQVQGECRRCLTEVLSDFATPAQAVFTTDPAATDDAAVYALVEPVTHIDLSEAVREEVVLAAPAYPLCREDCAGLCPRCGADLNLGPCEHSSPPTPAV